jgi:amidase
MKASDLHYKSLIETADAIKARRLSAVDLTKAMLARIERLDGRLKSYTTVTAELALDRARRAEDEIQNGRYRGPLHGIPIAVKDLCYTKDMPTTAGMIIHKDFRPTFDATVVKRLAKAGAVLLGKLHMTEGACMEHHPEMPRPTNPWKAELWTVVSSSGSGVATAAGLCYASIGSDTGGSIRFPSACNNLTGVKPTWGLVSRYGIFDLAASYDTIGPMARSAADAAAMLGALAGGDANDPTSLSIPVPDYLGRLDGVVGARGLRIGVDTDYNEAGADPETTRLVNAAATVLAELGAELRPIEFPDPEPLFAYLLDLMMVELAVARRETYPSRAERYGPWVSSGIDRARKARPVDLGRGGIERDKFRGRFARLFDAVDAVLLPVFRDGTPTWSEATARSNSDMNGFLRFTAPVNAVGAPSLTLPCGFSSDGRPVGFQLVGPHGSEATLLKAGHAYQQATDWHTLHPTLD